VKLTPFTTVLAVAVTTALTLTSCSTTEVGANADDRLHVVTTTTQLTDFVGQVGGDDIDLTGLLAPGSSAHYFDPTAADLLALGNADVLVMNGAGLDDFVNNAIDASGFSGIIIDASHGVDLERAREVTRESLDGEAHEHEGDDSQAHDEDMHDEGDHAHDATEAASEAAHDDAHDAHDDEHAHAHEHEHEEHEHDHDHGDLNPHLWTSPRFAQGMVEEIARGLADADAAHAERYEQRANELTQQLDTLDQWVAAQFARVPAVDRVLVTGHDSMRYYLHDYDITQLRRSRRTQRRRDRRPHRRDHDAKSEGDLRRIVTQPEACASRGERSRRHRDRRRVTLRRLARS
jgi:ABC-type Zn uptake system ZnuABC Zn-binding protein ZnuA